MALEIKGMKRVFKMRKNSQETVLDDPNVNMSPTEVMDFYSMNYPELTTATVHGPEIEDDRAVYEFKTTIGVKGKNMKKEQRKDKKPCTQLTERALKNLARLIISELENTDISRGIRNRKKRRLPPAESLMVF